MSSVCAGGSGQVHTAGQQGQYLKTSPTACWSHQTIFTYILKTSLLIAGLQEQAQTC